MSNICYINRFGQNYVYPDSDWKNHPGRALVISIIVILGSIIIHWFVNYLHEMRQQVYIFRENRKAAARANNKLRIIPV